MSQHDELKEKGNECIKRKQYQDAVEFYTAALRENPLSHTVYSNRSLAHFKLGSLDLALEDATRCVESAPTFARGYLRKCVALNGLARHGEAMAAAEAGYKLRGSDIICRECVGQWVIANQAVNSGMVKQFASEIGVPESEVLPKGCMVVSSDYFTIFLNVFLCRLEQTTTGVDVKFIRSCISTLLQELDRFLQLFGHLPWSHEQEWLESYCLASTINPSTSRVPQMVIATLLAKSDEFATWLDTTVDHALYPIIRPIFSLIVLAIGARCISLNVLCTEQHVVQVSCRACLPFLEKSPLSSEEYLEQHLGIYKELLEACATSNWQFNKEEIAFVQESISKLERLLTQFDGTKHHKEFYEKAMVSIGLAKIRLRQNPGFDPALYAPTSGRAISQQAEKQPKEVKAYAEEKHSMIQSVLDAPAAVPEETTIDIQDLLWSIGALLKSGENKMALEAFRVSESAYLRIFQQQLVNTAFSLDKGASVFHTPQIRILQNIASFLGCEDGVVADAVIRWKCIYSELHAILVRLGAGKGYLKTFQALQQMKTGIQAGESPLVALAQEHKREADQVMRDLGEKVIVCLFQQSCDQLQKVMRSDQLILEYCLNRSLEQPEDQSSDSKSGFLVALQPKGGALVREINFTEVLQLAQKWSKLLPATVVEKTHASKQKEAAAVGQELCKLLIPADVQRLIDSPHVKRVFICPEASLSVLPLELLPFGNGQILAEKCALVHLSAARELLRDSVVFAVRVSTIHEILAAEHTSEASESSPHDSEEVLSQSQQPGKREQTELADQKHVQPKSKVLSEPAKPSENLPEPKSKQCIIFADPNYKMEGTPEESVATFWESIVTTFTSLFIDSATDPAADSNLVCPLPDTKQEAENICQILSGSVANTKENLEVHCLLGDEATLIAALQVKSPFVLHFSTHGFSHPDARLFRSTFWDDMKSGILLAGANTYRTGKFKKIATEAGTGELTALAACGMDLQGTRLVYLSTCVSSYGLYSYGESVNSLAQAFRSAGAQTVIATLWEVHSKSATQFASYFYEAVCMTGTPPSLALSLAKRKIREETAYDDWTHWSPFVCIGEDAPLFSDTKQE